jgi:hypothetical protein
MLRWFVGCWLFGAVAFFGMFSAAQAQFKDIASTPSLQSHCMRLFGRPLYIENKHHGLALADDTVILQRIADELKTTQLFWFQEINSSDQQELGVSPRTGRLSDIFFEFEGTVRKVPKRWGPYGLTREIHRGLYAVLGAPIAKETLENAKIEHDGQARLADAVYAVYRFENNQRPIGFVRATVFGPHTFAGFDRSDANKRDNEILIEVFSAELKTKGRRHRFMQAGVMLHESFVRTYRGVPNSSSF